MRPSGATAIHNGIPASVMKRVAWPCGVTRYTAPSVDATSSLPNASKARPCGVGIPVAKVVTTPWPETRTTRFPVKSLTNRSPVFPTARPQGRPRPWARTVIGSPGPGDRANVERVRERVATAGSIGDGRVVRPRRDDRVLEATVGSVLVVVERELCRAVARIEGDDRVDE